MSVAIDIANGLRTYTPIYFKLVGYGQAITLEYMPKGFDNEIVVTRELDNFFEYSSSFIEGLEFFNDEKIFLDSCVNTYGLLADVSVEIWQIDEFLKEKKIFTGTIDFTKYTSNATIFTCHILENSKKRALIEMLNTPIDIYTPLQGANDLYIKKNNNNAKTLFNWAWTISQMQNIGVLEHVFYIEDRGYTTENHLFIPKQPTTGVNESGVDDGVDFYAIAGFDYANYADKSDYPLKFYASKENNNVSVKNFDLTDLSVSFNVSTQASRSGSKLMQMYINIEVGLRTTKEGSEDFPLYTNRLWIRKQDVNTESYENCVYTASLNNACTKSNTNFEVISENRQLFDFNTSDLQTLDDLEVQPYIIFSREKDSGIDEQEVNHIGYDTKFKMFEDEISVGFDATITAFPISEILGMIKTTKNIDIRYGATTPIQDLYLTNEVFFNYHVASNLTKTFIIKIEELLSFFTNALGKIYKIMDNYGEPYILIVDSTTILSENNNFEIVPLSKLENTASPTGQYMSVEIGREVKKDNNNLSLIEPVSKHVGIFEERFTKKLDLTISYLCSGTEINLLVSKMRNLNENENKTSTSSTLIFLDADMQRNVKTFLYGEIGTIEYSSGFFINENLTKRNLLDALNPIVSLFSGFKKSLKLLPTTSLFETDNTSLDESFTSQNTLSHIHLSCVVEANDFLMDKALKGDLSGFYQIDGKDVFLTKISFNFAKNVMEISYIPLY